MRTPNPHQRAPSGKMGRLWTSLLMVAFGWQAAQCVSNSVCVKFWSSRWFQRSEQNLKSVECSKYLFKLPPSLEGHRQWLGAKFTVRFKTHSQANRKRNTFTSFVMQSRPAGWHWPTWHQSILTANIIANTLPSLSSWELLVFILAYIALRGVAFAFGLRYEVRTSRPCLSQRTGKVGRVQTFHFRLFKKKRYCVISLNAKKNPAYLRSNRPSK
jgi:hypothetical protein